MAWSITRIELGITDKGGQIKLQFGTKETKCKGHANCMDKFYCFNQTSEVANKGVHNFGKMHTQMLLSVSSLIYAVNKRENIFQM